MKTWSVNERLRSTDLNANFAETVSKATPQTITAGHTWSASQTFSAGLSVTTGGITVSAGTTAVQALTATTGDFTALVRATATTTQLALRYDISNRLEVTVGATGLITYAAFGAGAGHTFTGGGISATTGTFSGAINSQTISATANFTGTVNAATSLSVASILAINSPGATELTFGVSVNTVNFGGNNTTVNLGPNATTVAIGGSNVINVGTSGASTVTIGGGSASLGFYGVTPIARAILATGTGKTVDNVITALQNLGLVKQS